MQGRHVRYLTEDVGAISVYMTSGLLTEPRNYSDQAFLSGECYLNSPMVALHQIWMGRVICAVEHGRPSKVPAADPSFDESKHS